MILVDNIVFMKQRFPLVWDAYCETEAGQDGTLVAIQPSRVQDFPTLCVNREGRSLYLHSRYDPQREAQSIVENINADGYEHVIFYGTGLGYHIQAFLNKYPHMSYSIYEPVPEVFNAYLSLFDLRALPQRGLHEIVVETSPADARAFLERTITRVQKNILFLDLPSYRNIFAAQYEAFLKLFREIVVNRRSSLAVEYTFEKRWVLNSLKNFKYVIETPNILVERAGYFKGKPAILVAAGPSLDYEIENLRYIKENNLAYIFSVGSAVNSLLAAGIYPHAQCTYDPGPENQRKVFARITEEKITDIPLIFGSSVGFEVLENYPGNIKLHMITSQDTVSSYLLKLDHEAQLDVVLDSPSIAVVTLQLLYKLGFDPIILVGQNLAYMDNRHYAGGIDYAEEMEAKREGLIKVKDVEGNDTYTSQGFNQMRLSMEHYISLMDGTTVINTTRGGASIAGTVFKYLDKLLADNFFRERVVEPEWYNIPVTSYDREHLKKRYGRFKKDYEELEPDLKAALEVLNEINDIKEKRSYNQLERSLGRLDKAFKKLRNNQVFKIIIQPMNRVAVEMLAAQIPLIKFEPDPDRKAGKVVDYYSRVVLGSLHDMQLIAPVIAELDDLVHAL